jgi:hypothetical protein|tara:strand:+ start:1139 stop:1372 length:234 start_codon:yes stop_codon:yes gene_type:complete
MARFILDVNSKNSYKMSEKQVDEICQSINEQLLNGEIFKIICIDDTTDNQFYETQSKNKLNNKQINNYNKHLKEMEE